MALVEVGNVYVIRTTLTKPRPKDKIVVCICSESNLFVWFNSLPKSHGEGQLACTAKGHPQALNKDCYLDLSRVTTFLPHELEAARDRGALSAECRGRICAAVTGGIRTLAPRHAALITKAVC
jgi:hypothetical protein